MEKQEKEVPWLSWLVIFLIWVISLVYLTGCENKSKAPAAMWPPGQENPIREQFGAKTQTFSIDAKGDTLLLGEKGTLFFIPEGALVTSTGEIPGCEIELEVVETYSQYDFITTGLGATYANRGSDPNEILESAGMVYFNAKACGQQLVVDKKLPIRIEFPAYPFKPGMNAFSGQYSESGNLNWQDPIKPDKSLVPVPLEQLDFFAPGKKVTVTDNGEAPEFDIAISDGSSGTPGVLPFELMEPVDDSVDSSDFAMTVVKECGIPRDMIELLYTPEYQNTLISTREFEQRMMSIHNTCDEEVLKLYMENLDKNLFEVDSLAGNYLHLSKGKSFARPFYDFASVGHTKVKNGPEAEILKRFSEGQLSELEENRQVEQARRQADYTRFLKKQRQTMLTNAFEFTSLGWINVDRFLNQEEAVETVLFVEATGPQNLENCRVCLVFHSISSVYFLERDEQGLFYCGSQAKDQKFMVLPQWEEVTLVATASGPNGPMLGKENIVLGESDRAVIELSEVSEEGFVDQLAEFKIELNLPDTVTQLARNSKPYCCGGEELNGETLFKWNCASCHSMNMYKNMTGPALAGVFDRVPSREWLYPYTRNSLAVIASGDEYAYQLYNEWNKTSMPPMPHLTDAQIDAIYNFIEYKSQTDLMNAP